MRLTPRESRTAGLFCYDAFFVFKSDVMLTVATQIEAPAKFLWAAVGAVARIQTEAMPPTGGTGGLTPRVHAL